MNLSLYSAATGMEAQQLNLNTIANNLANVNTPGFKRSKIEFQDLLYQNPRASGADSGGGNIVPTGVETGNPAAVLDGDIDRFLAAALAQRIEGADAAAGGG